MNNNKQRTINKNALFEGIGLHTGKAVVMKFLPAPENTGVVFIRSDLPNKPKIKASLENVISTNRGTVLKENDAVVNTVEHVLSALKGLGIDNMFIDLNDVEPPVMDGSAREYVKAILEAGIKEQEEPKEYISLKDKLFLEEKGKKMTYLPSDKFEVTFTLAYSDSIIAPQTVHVEINEEEYLKRIGISRTFGFEHEFEMLKANDLARGGSLENAIVINNDGTIRNEGGLRDAKELVLHKILDLIGDFSLLGANLKGHLIAEKSGHDFNTKFAKLLKEKFNQVSIRKDSDVMMYIEEIKSVLPHRYPFLLVDRIVSLVPGESICGYKNVTTNEEFFNGHYPHKPIMPGVLLVEAMAQVAGVLFLSQEENKGKTPFFCGIDRVRFRKPVVPGDRVDFTIKITKVRGATGKVEAEARVDGDLVAGGELMFQLV